MYKSVPVSLGSVDRVQFISRNRRNYFWAFQISLKKCHKFSLINANFGVIYLFIHMCHFGATMSAPEKLMRAKIHQNT